MITVLVIASVLLLFRWELLPRIINSCGDSLLKYEKLLVSLFAVLGTSMLIGLTIFIRGNQLVRHGSNKLIHNVPARVFGHFIQVTEVENFCPLNKTEITAVAETIRNIEANTAVVIDVYDRYIVYYDDVVVTSLVFLFSLLALTIGRVSTGVFWQQLDATRFQSLSTLLRTFFSATAVSYVKEFVLLITLVLVIVLMVGFRAIAAVGVTVCPDVTTLQAVLEASGLLARNATSDAGVISSELFDHIVLCRAANPFGLNLNHTSTDAVFGTVFDLGFECVENSTLICSNSTLPCGLYENSTNSTPPGFELVCPCSEYVQDITSLLTDCNGIAQLFEEAFETYFCTQLTEGAALIYISAILVLLSTLFLMIVFRMLSPVLSKLTEFPDFP